MVVGFFQIVKYVASETCDLLPLETCNPVTKMVPYQESFRKCSTVPKEICTSERQKPTLVKVPIWKKWCEKTDVTELPGELLSLAASL